jgi:tRNA1(Val) A37 N6-methylase TrmN6
LLYSYSLNQRVLLASLWLPEVMVIATEWNKIAQEFGLNLQLKDGCINGNEAIAWLKEQGNEIFYKSSELSPSFKLENQKELINFRPLNWIKNHHSSHQGVLSLVGCEELTNQRELTRFDQVQDLSSQFLCAKVQLEDHYQVWDVCSGAGGKSLNLLSRTNASFLLSDVRLSIVKNAEKRLKQLGYTALTQVIDVSNAKSLEHTPLDSAPFDVILADVPCSGSGTWFSEPEYFHQQADVTTYQKLQRAIVKNAHTYLKEGGQLYYMTCSVYKKENEENTAYFTQNLALKMVDECYFNGTRHQANSMYLAVFQKT